jgi:hypothetical protein
MRTGRRADSTASAGTVAATPTPVPVSAHAAHVAAAATCAVTVVALPSAVQSAATVVRPATPQPARDAQRECGALGRAGLRLRQVRSAERRRAGTGGEWSA